MKFSLIMADPPWQFKTYSDKGKDKSPEQHYRCLNIEDIKNIPVQNIAAKDSVLVMWVYNPMLPEAIEVMESWGYKFVTILFNWTKTTNDGLTSAFGTGYYTRHNTEICLLGKKGKGLKVKSHSIRQQVSTPKEQHSKKPEIVRDNLIELFGDVPRVELFARPNASNQTGWTLIGNEIDGLDINFAIDKTAKL